jgi:hypothetical protein
MNVILTAVFVAAVSIFLAVAVGAENKSLSAAQNKPFEFSQFLKDRPLDLGQLLGKHISEVAPGTTWESLSIPEEYKNPTIRYGVFARPDLRDYMKTWDFMTDDYCVSNYSMFLMFFNRGFVFRVELRLLPDSFAGSVKTDDPKYCADETSVFRMIARKLGGTIVERGNSYELTRYTNKYVMTLGTGERTTDMSWNLRGGPSSPNF